MKILVGYRGLDVGRELLEIALKHAKAFDGEVLVITSMKGGEKDQHAAYEEAEKNLKDAGQYFDENGVKSDIHLLVRGFEPGEDIVRFAREKNVDEIIIGVKSRSKVGKLLFGSTAQTVILRAPCPVVTVR
ncbi:MAG: universal stress protein [Desulfobacterium sp.]|nr:universal stress protein [Desulfobacterium sp.]